MALKLALVTGQRIGEVCGMTEDELDLAKALWTIPAERSKNGEAHKVPLSDMALELIAEARHGNQWEANQPLARCNRAGPELCAGHDKLASFDWTAHDLRRTVCTHLAKMQFAPLHIGAVANHQAKSPSVESPWAYMSNTTTPKKSAKHWTHGPRGLLLLLAAA